MRALIMFMFFIPIKSWACVEVLENTRVKEMAYNFYANNGADSCVRLPYIRKDFQPEGVHITDRDIAYISMHHKGSELPSRVVQADAKTGQVLKTYQLMSSSRGYMGKVESISLFDRDTKFVVPTGRSLCIFDKKNASLAADGMYKAKLISCQEQGLSGTMISFISYGPNKNGHKYIWAVGKGQKQAKIFGYKILGKRILKEPTYTFNVPTSVSNIRSLAVLKSNGNKYSFLLASSRGVNISSMYEVEYAYNEEKKSYTHKVTSHKDGKDSRKPASVVRAKQNNKVHKKVSLSKKEPKYLHQNLPSLHQTVQSMARKNQPLLPPK